MVVMSLIGIVLGYLIGRIIRAIEARYYREDK
jgi:hypothetical protein